MRAVDDDAPRQFGVRDIPTSQPRHGGVAVTATAPERS